MNAAVGILPRSLGLGASDAAPAVGLSKWKSPLELYLEKTGEAAREESYAIYLEMGKALEPIAIARFCKQTGFTVTDQQRQYVDTDWPQRWVTVDGIASDGGLVEAKSVGFADPAEWGDEFIDGAVPMQYLIQTQHGLACTRLAHAWMPVIVLNRQFRLYRVRRDDELIALLTERERVFMACVEARTPPDPISIDDASLRWPQDTGASITATPEIIEASAEFKTRKAALKEFEEITDSLKLKIQTFMGDNAMLVNSRGTPLNTWRTAKPSQVFDKDRFRMEHPQLYAQYEVERPGSRRFLVK